MRRAVSLRKVQAMYQLAREPAWPPMWRDTGSRGEVEGLRPSPSSIEISVLGAFTVLVGDEAVGPMSMGSQRLLVYLALHDRPVARTAIAGRMWPEATDLKAGVSLRAALSRLDGPARQAIVVDVAGLRLAATVTVDLRRSQALAHRLLQPDARRRASDLSPAAVSALSFELLPDCYEDWVTSTREPGELARPSFAE